MIVCVRSAALEESARKPLARDVLVGPIVGGTACGEKVDWRLRDAIAADGLPAAGCRAKESRGAIGSVKDARAGVLQITRPWSTEVTAGGTNDASSVEKDVTSVVHLSLVIEPN